MSMHHCVTRASWHTHVDAFELSVYPPARKAKGLTNFAFRSGAFRFANGGESKKLASAFHRTGTDLIANCHAPESVPCNTGPRVAKSKKN